MKWIGSIKHHDFKEVAIIEYNGETYDIKHFNEYSDGSIDNELRGEHGMWANTLRGAKRRVSLDSGYKAKDWNWKEIS